ncbi:MAG: serine/threonine-protein kinase, partial [Myxococcota bacterium]
MSQRRYRLLELLGEGGFGKVYRAELQTAGGFTKEVALKVLRPEAGPDEDLAARLRDEARILGLVRHRAIVGADALAQLEQGWAVVMEYVVGVDAAEAIAAGPLPEHVVLEIVEEVASALNAAFHAAPPGGPPLKMIHRDIKPQNVRLTPAGDVKVLDFGVARADFAAREAKTVSLSFGTLQYMAPERVEGHDLPAGDVYALGLCALVLLTGDADLKLSLHEERHARRVAELVGGLAREGRIAEGTASLLTRMVAFDAAARPAARAVEQEARALQAAAKGPPLRDWAEAHVPALVGARSPRRPDTVELLVERTGPMRLHPADTDRVGVRRRAPARWPWALAAVAFLLVLGGVAVAGGALRYLMATSETPVASPATAPAATPTATPTPVATPSRRPLVPAPATGGAGVATWS